ncbi:uncharacterized protein B0I36DRAFT_364629 [Microdochium trichocladiopsis]|uniref:Glycosyltransferase family 31 protein n=1 Tax=Microdochium trichocladiopsis TaxID=1682393 RepID=A0A9P9BKV6_9PEZI|nr:uncharacterized protein B0I36DRAFT_364629 [Microdochium trichocladiopsis]KAH7027427.1 hypothetical protein B0I36DRAFT_364629 [Microdochium trichocladiopsis]
MLAQSSTAQQQVVRVVAVVVASLGLWYFWLTNYDSLKSLPHLTGFPTLAEDDTGTLDFVRRAAQFAHVELSAELKYTKRCITAAKGVSHDRHEVVDVAEPLFTEPLEVDQGQPGRVINSCVPIALPFADAYPKTAKYNDLAFGMATKYGRLLESIDTIAYWAGDRGSLLAVVVEDYMDHESEVMELLAEFRRRNVNAQFMPPFAPNHTMSQSHFMILNKMISETGPETKWYGLLDDDTFFPHLAPLSAALGSFDSDNKDLYVGGLTEDWGSISRFGLMAYGGAGAYLSAHLARKLGAMDQALRCLEESPPELGDIIIRDCIYRHSGARLTVLPDLYQHDLLGDLRGFFESGVEPLNLHHWKSWYHEPVIAMAQATDFCGNCFLQRFAFNNDTVLANGYSISFYPKGLGAIDLNKMERTWGNVYGEEDPKYGYTLGPLRDRVPDGEHKTYYLKYTEARQRVMRQLYVWKGLKGAADEVVELVWTR